MLHRCIRYYAWTHRLEKVQQNSTSNMAMQLNYMLDWCLISVWDCQKYTLVVCDISSLCKSWRRTSGLLCKITHNCTCTFYGLKSQSGNPMHSLATNAQDSVCTQIYTWCIELWTCVTRVQCLPQVVNLHWEAHIRCSCCINSCDLDSVLMTSGWSFCYRFRSTCWCTTSNLVVQIQKMCDGHR